MDDLSTMVKALEGLPALQRSMEASRLQPNELVVLIRVRDDGGGYYQVFDKLTSRVRHVECTDVYSDLLLRTHCTPQFNQIWDLQQRWRWRNHMVPR
jgi:hypothetical protein